MNYLDILRAQLQIDEGVRNRPYRCTAGKLTVGVGHNLDDKPLSNRAIAVILEDDIADAEQDARALCPVFDQLSEGRKAVLCNMAFQLGRDRLAGFKKFLAALNAMHFQEAAREMGDSAWSRQTPARASRLITLMENG